MTGFSVNWNKTIISQQQPLSAEQVALAQTSSQNASLLINITFLEDSLLLGQQQLVTIKTAADAKLDIVTKRPDGSLDAAGTLQTNADKNGYFSFPITINNFHYLGNFTISVIATSGRQSNKVSGQFVVVASLLKTTPFLP